MTIVSSPVLSNKISAENLLSYPQIHMSMTAYSRGTGERSVTASAKAVLPLQDLTRVFKQTVSALALVEGEDGIDQLMVNTRVLRDRKHVNYVESDSDESYSEDSEHDEPATSSEDKDETNDFPNKFTPAGVLKELKKAWRQQPDEIRGMLSQDEVGLRTLLSLDERKIYTEEDLSDPFVFERGVRLVAAFKNDTPVTKYTLKICTCLSSIKILSSMTAHYQVTG